MDIYKINITEKAYDDIENIYDYIYYKQDPVKAKEKYERIKEKILKLDNMPYRFQQVQVEGNPYTQLRYMVVEKYVILFLIREETKEVTVRRVLFASSNWKNNL